MNKCGRLFAEALIILVPQLMISWIYLFRWGMGDYRFVFTVVLLILVLLVWRFSPFLRPAAGIKTLSAVVILLAIFQAFLFFEGIVENRHRPVDIGGITIRATRSLMKGKNPYAQRIDYRKDEPKKRGITFSQGYKYPPLTLISNMPFVLSMGKRGLYVFNFFCYAALCFLICALARDAASREKLAGLRGVVIFLADVLIPATLIFPVVSRWEGSFLWKNSPVYNLVPYLLFDAGVNDALAVALGLGAVWFAFRRKNVWAGIMLGLSLGAKQLPGVLLFVMLLPVVKPQKFIPVVFLSALVIYLPFFLWEPGSMIGGLIVFNFLRPVNTTSMRYFLLSPFGGIYLFLGLSLLVLIIIRWYLSKTKTLYIFVFYAFTAQIIFLLTNKIFHGNYFLWFIPYVAVIFGVAPFLRKQREFREFSQ